jgi:hypothetical protein
MARHCTHVGLLVVLLALACSGGEKDESATGGKSSSSGGGSGTGGKAGSNAAGTGATAGDDLCAQAAAKQAADCAGDPTVEGSQHLCEQDAFMAAGIGCTDVHTTYVRCLSSAGYDCSTGSASGCNTEQAAFWGCQSAFTASTGCSASTGPSEQCSDPDLPHMIMCLSAAVPRPGCLEQDVGSSAAHFFCCP